MATIDQDDGKTELRSTRLAADPSLGFWASLLWFVIAFVVSFVASVLLVVLVLFATNADVGGLKDEIRFEITLILNPISVLVFTGVLVWAVRRIKWSARDYFAVASPTRRTLVIAFIGACIFVLIDQLLSLYIDTDWAGSGVKLTRFRGARAAGAAPLALYCLYLVIVAPIAEEIAFRGFLYRGWSLPPLGPRSAIVLTAVAFSALHANYSWFGMLFVGASALFFGWLRWRSESIIPPMLSHSTVNLAALISFALET